MDACPSAYPLETHRRQKLAEETTDDWTTDEGRTLMAGYPGMQPEITPPGAAPVTPVGPPMAKQAPGVKPTFVKKPSKGARFGSKGGMRGRR